MYFYQQCVYHGQCIHRIQQTASHDNTGVREGIHYPVHTATMSAIY